MPRTLRRSLLLTSFLAFASVGCRTDGRQEPCPPPCRDEPGTFSPPPLVPSADGPYHGPPPGHPGPGGHGPTPHGPVAPYDDPTPLLPVPPGAPPEDAVAPDATPPLRTLPPTPDAPTPGAPIPVPPPAEKRGAPPMPTSRRGGTVLFPTEGDRGLMPVASSRRRFRFWPFGGRKSSPPTREERPVAREDRPAAAEPDIEREFDAMPTPPRAVTSRNPVTLEGIRFGPDPSFLAANEPADWEHSPRGHENDRAIPVSAVDDSDDDPDPADDVEEARAEDRKLEDVEDSEPTASHGDNPTDEEAADGDPTEEEAVEPDTAESAADEPTFDPNAPLPVIVPGHRRAEAYRYERLRELRPVERPVESRRPRPVPREDRRDEPAPVRSEPPRLSVPGPNPFAE